MALETDSSAASVTEGASQPTTSGVSSGTASAAMLKAAEAASSPASTEVASHGPTAVKPQSQGDLQAAALAAAKQPATEGQPGVAAPADAPALKQRFDAVYGKGQTAGTAEVFKSVGLDAANPKHREALGQSVAIYRALTNDSMGFLHELAYRLGVTLPSTKTPAAEEEWPSPELRSEDGKGAYSDAQVKTMLQSQEQRILKLVRGEMQPVTGFVQSEQETRQQNEAIAQATQTKDAILTRARSLPHFTKENEPKIASIMREMDPALKKQLGPAGALYEAYQTFVRENLPTLEATAEKSVRESFNKKAASAKGQVDPSGSGGDTGKVNLTGPAALASHMERLAAQFSQP